MMALPDHPAEDDSTPSKTGGPRGATAIIVGAIVVVLILVVVLHLTGVISGH